MKDYAKRYVLHKILTLECKKILQSFEFAFYMAHSDNPIYELTNNASKCHCSPSDFTAVNCNYKASLVTEPSTYFEQGYIYLNR